MKRILFLTYFFVAASIPCRAQWISLGGGGGYQVYAFGAHDSTSFFESTNSIGSDPTQLWRFVPNGITGHWGAADQGIDFSQGNITSFASLGRFVFAGQTQSNGTNDGEYFSTDNGANWNEMNIGSPVISNGSVLYGQDGYYTGTTIIPFIARSGDSGKSWDSLMVQNIKDMVANGTCIYVSSGLALWRSTDTGNTWSQLHPPFVGAMTVMDSLLFMTAGGNVIKSTDSGASWSAVAVDSAGIVPEHVNVLASDGKHLFAGATSGVFVSLDTGHTWRVANDGLTQGLDVKLMCVFDTLLFVDINPSDYDYYRPIRELIDTTPSGIVEQLPSSDAIELYPNPSMGTVSILAGGSSILGVRVVNVLGEQVLSTEYRVPSEVTLDLSKLPSGTYFVRVETVNRIILRKIVKE